MSSWYYYYIHITLPKQLDDTLILDQKVFNFENLKNQNDTLIKLQ